MTTFTLFSKSRLVIPIVKRLSTILCGTQQSVFTSNVFVNSRIMSQKITSFFKITPKKTLTAEDNQVPSNGNESDKTTECNENAKRTKRVRSTSNENITPVTEKKSPTSSEKKKKPKRQRIESSESDSEIPIKTSTNENDIKVEKDAPIKTSPKTKKSISGEEIVSKKKIKVEKLSVSPKSPKKESKKSPLISKSENVIKTENEKEDKQRNGAEVDYNPAKSKYHPIEDACWTKEQTVPYLALAKTLEIIEATSARLKMVEILSNYFRSVITLSPEDLLSSIYLCLNQLGPAYDCMELGIAETYLMKAVGQCTGRSLAQMRSAAHKQGDLGIVAEQARATQRTMFTMPPLQVRKVFSALKEIAAMTGQASVNKKIAKIQSLYVACRHSEARYLIRSLEGKLRIGLAEQSLLQALALAFASTPLAGADAGELNVASKMSSEKFKARVDEYALIIKTTYCECPNYDMIVPVLLQHGVNALPDHCKLTPGIPLKPMLAHPTKGVHEIFNRFENEEFTCEWKYDGERAQIHVPGDNAPIIKDAAIFSRNQENNTSKYPDILKRIPSLLKDTVKSCVLDCEAVAYDTATKQILPFQILSTRKRKDASEDDIKVQVCVFMFDLLYYNGRALVKEPLEERRRLLRENFNVVEGEWQMAVGRDCKDEDEIQQFLQEAVKASCEGLMVKMLKGENSRYDIARRSHNWLKLKKDYLDGVGDTIDTVVIGGYRGKGKRAGAFGGFLLACYDPATEQYQSLCKIGTGFSDEDLKTLSETLNACVIDGPRNYYMYDNSHAPDEWFAATCVWEIRCADLSLSPAHRAAIGLVDPDKGISLRFPRFIRVRDDKTPEQSTSAQQVAQLYLSQDQVKNSNTKHLVHDDFY